MVKIRFEFTDVEASKESVTIQHSSKIKVYKTTKQDHLDWYDEEGNKRIYRDYIVVEVPNNIRINWSKWNPKYDNNIAVGFYKEESDDKITLYFYDQLPFTWIAKNIERIGLAKVQIRIIPSWKEYGELFPLYIDAKGIYQWSYNLFFGLLQLPYMIHLERKTK